MDPVLDVSDGQSRPTKSVIRIRVVFRTQMVTGEFYARVTRCRVTTVTTAFKRIRDKRPACGWLRSSSYNFPDQRDAVIKSLSKNSVVSATVRRADGQGPKETPGRKVSIVAVRRVCRVCWKLLLIGKF